MIKITFPDGSVREYAEGTTAYQIAESISPRLAADSLAASVNGATVDMTRPIEADASVKFYKWDDEEGKHAFWHTSSHLLAEALEALYPGIKFGIGPAIENGFYYDVDSPVPITEADLPTIENKMVELSRNKETLIRREVPKAEALETFTGKGDQYKVELISDLEDGTISFYTNGAFTDLCRGPHIPNTGYIKALKLTSVAGAYWRGNEKNKMLTRIYGISFPKKSMLDEYLVMMEEAKKRDHRKLGKDLELFTFSQRVGQGLPLWLPKGAALRDRLEQFLRNVQKEYGYQQVITPHIGNKELYVTSGHYAKYGKDSFQPIHTDRGRGVPAQTDELPAPLRNLPFETPFVQGTACASGRIRNGLPLRAVGRAPRTDARARVHAGRRPFVRAAGSASRRVRTRDRHRALYLQNAEVRQLHGTDFAA